MSSAIKSPPSPTHQKWSKVESITHKSKAASQMPSFEFVSFYNYLLFINQNLSLKAVFIYNSTGPMNIL